MKKLISVIFLAGLFSGSAFAKVGNGSRYDCGILAQLKRQAPGVYTYSPRPLNSYQPGVVPDSSRPENQRLHVTMNANGDGVIYDSAGSVVGRTSALRPGNPSSITMDFGNNRSIACGDPSSAEPYTGEPDVTYTPARRRYYGTGSCHWQEIRMGCRTVHAGGRLRCKC